MCGVANLPFIHNKNIRGDLVAKENRPPRTFVEWMLQLLEERFPWLGKTADEQISGADTVDQLTDLHRELKRGRRTNRRNGRKSGN
jgi:hypothetical protein